MKLDRVIAVRNNKTVFRDGRRCVKIFSPEFSKTAVLEEALNHARVEACIEYVPKLLEVIRHNRNWAIVYDFIKGKTVLQWMEEEPEALEEQAAFFAELHVSLHKNGGGELNGMKSVFCEKILEAPLDPSLKHRLYKGLENMRFSSALCHVDFVPSNVIVDQEGSFFVIDWASALAGEPLADAALTWLELRVKGYGDFADEYRRVYVRKAQVSDEAFDAWIPYVAAFQMNYSNEAERALLLEYINNYENKGEKE